MDITLNYTEEKIRNSELKARVKELGPAEMSLRARIAKSEGKLDQVPYASLTERPIKTIHEFNTPDKAEEAVELIRKLWNEYPISWDDSLPYQKWTDEQKKASSDLWNFQEFLVDFTLPDSEWPR